MTAYTCRLNTLHSIRNIQICSLIILKWVPFYKIVSVVQKVKHTYQIFVYNTIKFIFQYKIKHLTIFFSFRKLFSSFLYSTLWITRIVTIWLITLNLVSQELRLWYRLPKSLTGSLHLTYDNKIINLTTKSWTP